MASAIQCSGVGARPALRHQPAAGRPQRAAAVRCAAAAEEDASRRGALGSVIDMLKGGNAAKPEASEAQTSSAPAGPTRRKLLSTGGMGAIGALSAGLAPMCPCCGYAEAAEMCPTDYENLLVNAPPPTSADWGYGVRNGPHTWSKTWQEGCAQSPVDLPMSKLRKYDDSPDEIVFDYAPQANCKIVNPGFGTPTVVFEPGQFAHVGGRKLELLQFHFHTPSEHTFDGVHAAMEAHLVHKDVETGGLAVMGVMMRRGKSDRLSPLQVALRNAPAPGAPAVKTTVDVHELLPPPDAIGVRQYIRYNGSLTTPPLSEGVSWFVFRDGLRVPADDILDFMSFVGDGITYSFNAREPMPLNDRDFMSHI